MGLQTYKAFLSCPEDSLDLCQGKNTLQDFKQIQLTEKNLLDAAEVLIAIGADKNLFSQFEVISRAFDFG